MTLVCPRSLLLKVPQPAPNRESLPQRRREARLFTVCPTQQSQEAFSLDIALRELAAASRITGTDGHTLRDALHQYATLPWVASLVGITAPGRATVIDSLAHRQLGTVTADTLGDRIGDLEAATDFLIDTPGFDSPRATIAQLEPVTTESDILIWVVDGSKKISANERLMLTSIRRIGQPVHVVMTNLDKENTRTRQAAIQRARNTLTHIAPLTIRIVDKTTASTGLSHLVRRIPWESPRRMQHLERGLASIREWLSKNMPSESPLSTLTYLTRRWRNLSQLACDSVLDSIISGRAVGRTRALKTLHQQSVKSNHAFIQWLQHTEPFAQWLRQTGLLALPLPATLEETPWRQVTDLIGGHRLATRSVLHAAEQWRLEGELQIQNWLELAEYYDKPLKRRDCQRLEEAVQITDLTLRRARQMLRDETI
jgi:hypothetical protein